jgi:cytochrome c-type biogenesis protein CcmH/NrfG
MKDTDFHPRYALVITSFLVIAIVVVYIQVVTFDFTSYDSATYVYENQYVKAGLTPKSIHWAFTATTASNWHPLTWLSHMLDVQLYGLNPGWHHLTNVLLHTGNTFLLFWVICLLTGNMVRSGFVAALFALHPLHVQSVAWIAERKDVLSTFFALLAIWSYVRYAQYPRVGRFMPVVLFFILGLMAKPMIVTLPFVLLLLDYWPLKRLRLETSKKVAGVLKSIRNSTALIIEKIPLFCIAAASCIVTVYAQHAGGAISTLAEIPLHVRIANALISYVSYIGKMFWPSKLAVIYPYSEVWPVWQIVTAFVLLAGITFLALRCMTSKPWVLVGWFWYLGTLVPVIGLVQVGAQAMADRYTYVPLIGLFIILTWGISELWHRHRFKNFGAFTIAAAALILLMGLSWKQVGYWKNSVTLFEHTLAVTKNNYVAHNNLGHRLLELGQPAAAIPHFEKALQINPAFEVAHLNLGLALSNQGKFEEATSHYSKALKIKPDYAVAHNNIGNVFYRLGKADEAINHYLQALRIDSEYAEAYNNLGAALIQLGEIEKAVMSFRKALEVDPGYIDAQNNLENTLAALRTKHQKK